LPIKDCAIVWYLMNDFDTARKCGPLNDFRETRDVISYIPLIKARMSVIRALLFILETFWFDSV
jgi:hypothetical protein